MSDEGPVDQHTLIMQRLLDSINANKSRRHKSTFETWEDLDVESLTVLELRLVVTLSPHYDDVSAVTAAGLRQPELIQEARLLLGEAFNRPAVTPGQVEHPRGVEQPPTVAAPVVVPDGGAGRTNTGIKPRVLGCACACVCFDKMKVPRLANVKDQNRCISLLVLYFFGNDHRGGGLVKHHVDQLVNNNKAPRHVRDATSMRVFAARVAYSCDTRLKIQHVCRTCIRRFRQLIRMLLSYAIESGEWSPSAVDYTGLLLGGLSHN